MRLLELEIESTGILARKLVGGRLLGEALDELAADTAHPHRELLAHHDQWPLGWLELPRGGPWVRASLYTAQTLREECSELVVCGIGGSALGAQAVYAAMDWPVEYLLPVQFLDNVDPTQMARVVEGLQLVDCAVNVISKSGETLETMAGFLHLLAQLKRAAPDAASLARRIVATTDATKGLLRPLAQEQGWRTLPVPSDVGGRFSVFSAVGLLPLAFAGVDIEALLAGARELQDEIAQLPAAENPAWRVAALQYLLHIRGGMNQIVHYIYGDPLVLMGDFFRQLWAESLAKARRLDGSPSGVCLTPLVARGSTDQHSQNQLYMEGPDDKLYCFISCRQWEIDPLISLPEGSRIPELAYIDDRRFGEILAACMAGTRGALIEAGRPVFELRLPRIGAQEIGAYLQFWMLATAYAGLLYGVNPFDQPGVERSKVIGRQALGSQH